MKEKTNKKWCLCGANDGIPCRLCGNSYEEKTNSHGSGASIRDSNPPSVTHLEKLMEECKPRPLVRIPTIRDICEAILKDKPGKFPEDLLLLSDLGRGWSKGYNEALDDWEDEIKKGLK